MWKKFLGAARRNFFLFALRAEAWLRLYLFEVTFMAKITYIEHSGKEHLIDVKPGQSVMEGAVKNNIPGIDADCGGACACATCHVYVDDTWADKTGKASVMEESMLDFANDLQPTSRLSCQIIVSDALDGLIVRMPENQH